MSKKLYKIWYVQHNRDKPCKTIYMTVEFDAVKKTWAYPLVDVLDSFPRFDRDDVVSLDFAKLQETCDYLNEMADEDVHYEIREESYPDWLP